LSIGPPPEFSKRTTVIPFQPWLLTFDPQVFPSVPERGLFGRFANSAGFLFFRPGPPRPTDSCVLSRSPRVFFFFFCRNQLVWGLGPPPCKNAGFERLLSFNFFPNVQKHPTLFPLLLPRSERFDLLLFALCGAFPLHGPGIFFSSFFPQLGCGDTSAPPLYFLLLLSPPFFGFFFHAGAHSSFIVLPAGPPILFLWFTQTAGFWNDFPSDLSRFPARCLIFPLGYHPF